MNNTVILSAQSASSVANLSDLLRTLGLDPQFHTLGSVQSPNFASARFGVIVATEPIQHALTQTTRWRAETASRYFPIVWVLDHDFAEWTRAAYEAGADQWVLTTDAPEFLRAKLQPILRSQELSLQLTGKAEEVRLLAERVQRQREQLDRDVMLAKQLEQARRPALGSFPGVSVGVHQKSSDRIGGDSLHILPIGDEILVILADTVAMPGCGSSLVSHFVRELAMADAVAGKGPGMILGSVNDALLRLNLPDPPMVSLAVVRYSLPSGKFTFARGGLPMPILTTQSGVIEAGSAPGPYLGLSKGEYPTQAGKLSGGESLLVATDGVVGANPLAEAVRIAEVTDAQAFVDAVAKRLNTTADFTLLALQRSTPHELTS